MKMRKYIACLALCLVVLTSCNPLVVKITLGAAPAQPTSKSSPSSVNEAAPAGADTPTAEATISNGAANAGNAAAQGAGLPPAAVSATPSGKMANAALVAGTPAACVTSSPSSAAYKVNVCINAPTSTLAGDAQVSATAEVSGGSSTVQRMIFYLDGRYLLTSFHAPYSFTLPTTLFADGTHTLAVKALTRDGFNTDKAAQTITLKNGATNQPGSAGKFTPTTGTNPPNGAPFVVVAAGDGAGGEPNAGKAVDLIASLNPNLFLYLGDVYEEGSPAEFFNYYGVNGAFYSRFRSITDPTIGNHEYLSSQNAAGYFDYWNNVPNYYSFDAGGWHFISLNANDGKIEVGAGSPQYAWLKQDLATRANACTIVYYHQPLFNIGPEGSTAALGDIWALMAQYHVTLVLNGHDHDYQRWVPLDAHGNPSASGITEFIAGGGGHGVQKISHTDTRVAFSSSKSPETIGALKLSLTSSEASFAYLSINGSTLDSGTVPCQK